MVQSLPSIPKIVGGSFTLQRVQAVNPTRGGNFMSVDLAEPLWSAEISTTPLSRAQAGPYDAFFAELRGTQRTAYVWDAKRPRPYAYHSTGAVETVRRIGSSTRRIGSSSRRIAASFTYAWGTPTITAISRTNGTLSVANCVAGMSWAPGDYIAWDDGETRRLHIVIAAATADASGAVVLTVEPTPPEAAGVTLPVAAIIEKAAAEMIVLQATVPWTVSGQPSASFKGVQVLRPNAA